MGSLSVKVGAFTSQMEVNLVTHLLIGKLHYLAKFSAMTLMSAVWAATAMLRPTSQRCQFTILIKSWTRHQVITNFINS